MPLLKHEYTKDVFDNSKNMVSRKTNVHNTADFQKLRAVTGHIKGCTWLIHELVVQEMCER